MWAEEIVAQLTKEQTQSHKSIYTHMQTRTRRPTHSYKHEHDTATDFIIAQM